MAAVFRLVVISALAGSLALPAAAAPASTTRHLHESDSGRTIHVPPGDKLTVQLPGGSGGGYHRPRSSNEYVVDRVWSAGGYPSDADAQANFFARHRGKSDLTSITDYLCLHTNPRCLPPQKQWVVHIVVD